MKQNKHLARPDDELYRFTFFIAHGWKQIIPSQQDTRHQFDTYFVKVHWNQRKAYKSNRQPNAMRPYSQSPSLKPKGTRMIDIFFVVVSASYSTPLGPYTGALYATNTAVDQSYVVAQSSQWIHSRTTEYIKLVEPLIQSTYHQTVGIIHVEYIWHYWQEQINHFRE